MALQECEQFAANLVRMLGEELCSEDLHALREDLTRIAKNPEDPPVDPLHVIAGYWPEGAPNGVLFAGASVNCQDLAMRLTAHLAIEEASLRRQAESAVRGYLTPSLDA